MYDHLESLLPALEVPARYCIVPSFQLIGFVGVFEPQLTEHMPPSTLDHALLWRRRQHPESRSGMLWYRMLLQERLQLKGLP